MSENFEWDVELQKKQQKKNRCPCSIPYLSDQATY